MGDGQSGPALVLGRGWQYQLFDRGLPTRQMLDSIVPDRPAQILSYDGHTAWVNTKALQLAAITRRTPDPKNGAIVKDARTGQPTGPQGSGDGARRPPGARADTRRSATGVARGGGRSPALRRDERAGRRRHSRGSGALRRGGTGRRARVRVYAAVTTSGAPDEPRLEGLEDVRQKYADGALFKAGALEIRLDGVIEAHTAAMLAPSANGGTRPTPPSLPMISIAACGSWMPRLAGDDSGSRRPRRSHGARCLRACRAVQLDTAARRRHRIEHMETVDPLDIARFGALGVIASMQPFHASPTPGRIDGWTRHLGEERAAHAWPYRSIVAGRGRLASAAIGR